MPSGISLISAGWGRAMAWALQCLHQGGKGHWVEGAQEENKVQRENKRGCAVLSLLNPQSPGSPRGEGAGL